MSRLMVAQLVACPPQYAAALATGMASLAKMATATAATGGLDLQDSRGQTCLMLAAAQGLDSLVQVQLVAGAKVERACDGGCLLHVWP